MADSQQEPMFLQDVTKHLLVINSYSFDEGVRNNYLMLFKDITTITYYDHERGTTVECKLEVDQADWNDVNLSSYSDSGVIVNLKPARQPIKGSSQDKWRTFKPDFLLIRNITYGLPKQDYRNLLYGFMHADIPSVNSLQSIYMNLERPVMYGALKSIQNRLGKEKFNLIPQTYWPNHHEASFTPDYPIVCKIGHTHAGYGKIRFENYNHFKEFVSVMALHNDYCTGEHFIHGDYDLRIQKIGNNYRAYKRISDGWKGNMSTAVMEDIPMTPKFKLWCDEASKLFGGMDILAVDAIHSQETDEDIILEVNDTSIGLGPAHEAEDLVHIRDLVIQRMKEAFSEKSLHKKLSKGTDVNNNNNNNEAAIETVAQVEQQQRSVGSNVNLEVDLINERNARTALELRVAELEAHIKELEGENQQLRQSLRRQRQEAAAAAAAQPNNAATEGGRRFLSFFRF